MFKVSLPAQLLIILGSVVLFGNMLSDTTVQFFYSISLTFKECLSFLLPFMVFAFICSGILSFKKRAPVVMGVLLGCILISNGLTALFAYLVSTSMLCPITNCVTIQNLTLQNDIVPLWLISLPRLIASEQAMLLAVIVGLLLSYINLPQCEIAIHRFKSTIEWIMNSLFIPILPLYIFGFLLEIHHKGVFLQLFQSYGKTFALIFILHMIVIGIVYLIASSFHVSKAFEYIQNAIPSYLTAFGTMSSTATIPVTIKCAQKNLTPDNPLIPVATPILANVHLLGDAISTPILAIVTLFLFTNTVPTIATFCTFIMYFCLTMLAVSGVPGGGILVMIPILKSILGFSDAMISIITTLYVLQDAIGTAANVMGDGALMIIVDKLLHKMGIR